MQYKCKVTVIDKKCFQDLQENYLADPNSGPCPFYQVGDQFLFERYGGEDTFWREGNGAHCAEAWDCISRYIYTALQGGSIMRGWTNDERMMIACCNDGTRPVIFKIERQDYMVVRPTGTDWKERALQAEEALGRVENAGRVWARPDKGWIEVFTTRENPPREQDLREAAGACGLVVEKIE